MDRIMKKMCENKYLIYTVCFWGFIGPLIYYISSIGLFSAGTSDAISQIYPIMLYTRRVILDFITSAFDGNEYVFPMFDYTIGMGEDTISALNWHGFGDPFYFFTIFVSEDNLPYFYSVLFYTRVYLSGGAFIAFASFNAKGRSTGAYVIGALVYSFTGFTLQSNAHAIFTHAMLYIPLMLLGAEKSIHGQKKWLLCITTWLFALSGFYFCYIGSVVLAVYVIYRLFREKRGLKDAIKSIMCLIIEYLVGLGLAAIIFIPAVMGFFASDRVATKLNLPIVMSWAQIKEMLINMFLPSYSTEQELAVCTIGMITLICILTTKGKKQEKINLAFLFMMAIIPFVSCVMSGFGECYQRWMVAINLYIAYLVCAFWDEILQITLLQKIVISVVYILLLLYGKLEDILENSRYSKTVEVYGVLLISIFVASYIIKKYKDRKWIKVLFFVIVYISICVNWKEIARDREISLVQGRKVVDELLGDIGDQEFFRIDNERGFAEPRIGMNVSLQQGYPGTMEYVSIENNSYIMCFDKWDIASKDHNVYGLDQRSIMESLCAVKYYIGLTENDSIVPYGFEFVKATQDGEWSLYENRNVLPIAYFYEKVYDFEDYSKLSGVEKQQVMLNAAAVEGYQGDVTEYKKMQNSFSEGDYVILDADGEIVSDEITKMEAGTEAVIETTLKAGCENYLIYTNESGERLAAVLDIRGYTKYPTNIVPIVINLGTVDEDEKVEINIKVSNDMMINRDVLKIVHYDLSEYSTQIQKLSMLTEDAFEVKTNSISGEIEVVQKGILNISVPYSEGWHARIDGKAVQTYRVNDLFIGVEIPEGKHKIELVYITPGIRIGLIISSFSFIVAIIYMIYQCGIFSRKERTSAKQR